MESDKCGQKLPDDFSLEELVEDLKDEIACLEIAFNNLYVKYLNLKKQYEDLKNGN